MAEYIEREAATNVACNILWKMNYLSTLWWFGIPIWCIRLFANGMNDQIAGLTINGHLEETQLRIGVICPSRRKENDYGKECSLQKMQ